MTQTHELSASGPDVTSLSVIEESQPKTRAQALQTKIGERSTKTLTPPVDPQLTSESYAWGLSEDTHYDNFPEAQRYVLDSNDRGEAVVYHPESDEYVAYRPDSVPNVISQETVSQGIYLPDNIQRQINDAGNLDNAIKIYYEEKNKDPLLSVAILEEAARLYAGEDATDKIHHLADEAVDTAANVALGNVASVPQENGFDAMFNAFKLTSPEKRDELLGKMKYTVHIVQDQVHAAEGHPTGAQPAIDPTKIEAASHVLMRVSDAEVTAVDVAAVLNKETMKLHLLDQQRLLREELARLEEDIDFVDRDIEQEVGPAKRHGVFSAVRNLLSSREVINRP